MRVAELKAVMKEHELRGYSWLRKAELIALLRDNIQPPHTPAPRTRPPRPTRPPPPPQVQSVRFRPDRPRQPELMRRLEGISTPQSAPRPAVPADPLCRGPHKQTPPPKQDTEFKPYQLKP